MARYGQRPENALKRANEFISVGKPARALDTLQDVFRNKKWAYSWSESVLEPIMFKYLDLCVELKRSHIAKEGLFQYRNMFQAVNVGSLENVIRGYLRMAEEKTENAREQSAQAVIDIDDLDNLATPESILLSAVSGEDAQDRSDRTILTPWVKFLWESYCQCLELLRINSHVESLYHDIARMAFQFCLRYNRKTEFRKLCDKLRKHLEDICKVPTQVANVSIAKPETQQLNLETRLYQLDSAIQMELWQEAYKAIEDIHGLMNMSKKPPVPKTMANYYQKLAMVFWKAGNQLFHAAALLKLFQLSREMKKNMSGEELHRMACRVLVATLAVPLPSAHPEFDRFIETDKSPLEKAQRLAILLGLQHPPTRASLLRDMVRTNVVTLASPPLQQLHRCLEIDFDPLELCSKVYTITQTLTNTTPPPPKEGEETTATTAVVVVVVNPLAQYVPALHDVTLVRLVRQVAQVYQTVEFARLLQLAQFASAFHLERLLVECVRHNDMQIRIDHARACIHFGMDLSESQREDRPEGPTLQTMPSEQVRQQLVNMSVVLHRASHVINPQWRKKEREQRRAALVAAYHDCKYQDHQLILQRHKIIEDRKEYIERLNSVREEEEARRLEELQRQQAIAEHKRLVAEREERERKREQNEIKQIRDRHLKEKMQQISQTSAGQKLLRRLDEDDIKRLDADQIAAREAEEQQKERRELQAKLKSQEKKVDYLERAKRLEEIPLMQANMAERQTADQAFWEQQEDERIKAALEERKIALSTKERLERMQQDRALFMERLMSERSAIYADKVREFELRLEAERKQRLLRRKQQRREDREAKARKDREEAADRRVAAAKHREEAESKAREEAARKVREERERAEREERLRLQKEQQEMLERVAAKQRQREEEVERKLQEEREKFNSGGGGGGKSGPERGGGAPADSWRSGGGAGREPPAAVTGAAAAASADKAAPISREKEDTWRSKSGAEGKGGDAGGGGRAEAWKPSRMRSDGTGPAPASGDKGREEGGGGRWRRDENRDRDNNRDSRDDGGRKRFERDDRERERDRDSWYGGGRGGGVRDDRDRDGERGGGGGGGSWRKAGEERGGDSSGGGRGGGGGNDWRRDAPRERPREDRDRDEKRPSDRDNRQRPAPSDETPPSRRPAPPAAAEDKRRQGGESRGEGEDGWEMQKRR